MNMGILFLQYSTFGQRCTGVGLTPTVQTQKQVAE